MSQNACLYLRTDAWRKASTVTISLILIPFLSREQSMTNQQISQEGLLLVATGHHSHLLALEGPLWPSSYLKRPSCPSSFLRNHHGLLLALRSHQGLPFALKVTLVNQVPNFITKESQHDFPFIQTSSIQNFKPIKSLPYLQQKIIFKAIKSLPYLQQKII